MPVITANLNYGLIEGIENWVRRVAEVNEKGVYLASEEQADRIMNDVGATRAERASGCLHRGVLCGNFNGGAEAELLFRRVTYDTEAMPVERAIAALSLAFLYARSDRLSEAERLYRFVIRFEQTRPADRAAARLYLGVICCNSKRSSEAEELFRRVINDNQATPIHRAAARLYLGSVCEFFGRFDEAAAFYREVVGDWDARPADRVAARLYLGSVCEFFGRFDEAAVFYHKVIEDDLANAVDRTNARRWVERIARNVNNRLRQAEEFHNEVTNDRLVYPSVRVQARLSFGSLLEESNHERAEHLFEGIIGDPDATADQEAEARIHLAALCINSWRYVQARDFLNAVINNPRVLQQNQYRARRLLGTVPDRCEIL